MNRIIKIERSYKPLIYFAILIVVFLIVRKYILTELRDIYNQQYTNIWNQSLKLSYYDTLQKNSYLYGTFIIIYSLFIFLSLNEFLKSSKEKWSFLIIQVVFVFLVFALTSYESQNNEIEQDNYYISLIIFIPYLLIIYSNSLIGKQKDITKEVSKKQKEEDELQDDDLKKLFHLDLITQKEYNEKKMFQIKERIRKNLKDTEEYNLLMKSKEKGLLSENELKNKIEILINLKFKALK